MSRPAALFTASLALAACNEPKPSPAPPSAPALSASSSASAAPPPSPIPAAIPALAPPPLARRAECAKDTTCTLTHLVPDEVRPTLSDGAPAVIWEEAIGERATIAFPRDEDVELIGVVLDGSVDLTPMDTQATSKSTVGARWSAFRVPGGGVSLTGAGGKAARVALVVANAGGGALGAHIDARDKPGAPAAWKVRKKRIDVVDFEKAPDFAWGGGAYHARVGWEASTYRHGDSNGSGSKTWEVDDKPAAVVDLVQFSRDAGVAEHVHDKEWEILAVLQGDGDLVRKTPAGEEITQLRAGAITSIPAGVRHAWKPSGKAPVFAIQVYAPPGPEQRFKKLAAPAR